VVDPAISFAFIKRFPGKLRHARLVKNEAFFAMLNPHIAADSLASVEACPLGLLWSSDVSLSAERSPWHASRFEIAGVLKQIVTLLELKAENPFKIRAYTNAARDRNVWRADGNI
jgi:hypothetical protein